VEVAERHVAVAETVEVAVLPMVHVELLRLYVAGVPVAKLRVTVVVLHIGMGTFLLVVGVAMEERPTILSTVLAAAVAVAAAV
jgi:uncharacterized membrane protein